jgi:hypothetical protein
MEAIGGTRAYGVVVCILRTVGRPQDAPSFRYKKGNTVQLIQRAWYLYTFRVMQQKELN